MGDISHRTAWYELAKRPSKNVLRWMPFYTVIVDGVVGRMLEPVDCMKRMSLATSETTKASRYAQKEVNDMKEMFWGRQAGLSDETPGQPDMTLHSLDWDWPK
jgi:hypothetical protein